MNYKLGDSGGTVKSINTWLDVQGDVFTEETESRVKQFQASRSSAPTGVVDAITWAGISVAGTALGTALGVLGGSGIAVEAESDIVQEDLTPVSELLASGMRTSEKGKRFIQKHEGFRKAPYKDTAGVPTIGYGNTYYPSGKRVTMQDSPLTDASANALFDLVVQTYENSVRKLGVQLKQQQFDALVSFNYNIGTGAFWKSTLCKKVLKNPDDPTIKQEFLKWVRAGGVVSKGLQNRRNYEIELYFNGKYQWSF